MVNESSNPIALLSSSFGSVYLITDQNFGRRNSFFIRKSLYCLADCCFFNMQVNEKSLKPFTYFLFPFCNGLAWPLPIHQDLTVKLLHQINCISEKEYIYNMCHGLLVSSFCFQLILNIILFLPPAQFLYILMFSLHLYQVALFISVNLLQLIYLCYLQIEQRVWFKIQRMSPKYNRYLKVTRGFSSLVSLVIIKQSIIIPHLYKL